VQILESLGLSFQLGSLDENGVLTLWVCLIFTSNFILQKLTSFDAVSLIV